VSAEDYLAFAGELAGVEPRITYSPDAYWPLWADVTHMHEVLGRCQIPWQDGFRRVITSAGAGYQPQA
jgi:hypothetical protein